MPTVDADTERRRLAAVSRALFRPRHRLGDAGLAVPAPSGEIPGRLGAYSQHTPQHAFPTMIGPP